MSRLLFLASLCIAIPLYGDGDRRNPCSEQVAKVVVRWNREKIAHLLRRLHEAGLPYHRTAIRRPTPQMLEAMERILKHSATGNAVDRAIRTQFGSFAEALTFAELKRDRPLPVSWTEHALGEALEALWRGNYPIHKYAVVHATSEMLAVMESALGRPVRVHGMMRAGILRYGTWNNTLEHFHYDLEEVARRSTGPRTPWNEIPRQVQAQRERVDVSEDLVMESNLLGRPPEQVLQLAQQRELLESIQSSSTELSESDAGKLLILVEAILKHPKRVWRRDLPALLEELGEERLSVADAERLLEFLRNHPRLLQFREAS